jgi:hypothetical protein
MERAPNKHAKQVLRRSGELNEGDEPWLVTLSEARRLSGFSRSKLYLLANDGVVEFFKNNGRIMVGYGSLKRAVDALPRARINIGGKGLA